MSLVRPLSVLCADLIVSDVKLLSTIMLTKNALEIVQRYFNSMHLKSYLFGIGSKIYSNSVNLDGYLSKNKCSCNTIQRRVLSASITNMENNIKYFKNYNKYLSEYNGRIIYKGT